MRVLLEERNAMEVEEVSLHACNVLDFGLVIPHKRPTLSSTTLVGRLITRASIQ